MCVKITNQCSFSYSFLIIKHFKLCHVDAKRYELFKKQRFVCSMETSIQKGYLFQNMDPPSIRVMPQSWRPPVSVSDLPYTSFYYNSQAFRISPHQWKRYASLEKQRFVLLDVNFYAKRPPFPSMDAPSIFEFGFFSSILEISHGILQGR